LDYPCDAHHSLVGPFIVSPNENEDAALSEVGFSPS